MVMTVLLFPFKLILKIILYTIYLVIAFIGLIIKGVSMIAGIFTTILSIIMAIGFIYIMVCQIQDFLNTNEQDFTVLRLVTNGFFSCAIPLGIFLLPVISTLIGEFISMFADLIRGFASFSLIGRKRCQNNQKYKNVRYAAEDDIIIEDLNFNFIHIDDVDIDEIGDDDEYDDEYIENDSNLKDDDIKDNQQKNNLGFFDGIHSMEELKKRYKDLARCFHPDTAAGETNEAMSFINSEYERLKSKFEETCS